MKQEAIRDHACLYSVLRCIEIYRETRWKGFQACMPNIQYMARC